MDLTPYVGGLQTLPAGIQHRIQQAAGALIGSLTKVPKAWIDERAQDIHSKATGRRAIEKAAIDAAKKAVKDDDEIINATLEVYLPSAIRKARNKSKIFLEAGSEFDAQDHQGADTDTTAPIDEDWMNMFARQAEDASSERMQSLLGKILAGEIRTPGSFSPSALRVVAEMDQEMASDLQIIASQSIDDLIFTDPTWQSGEQLLFGIRAFNSGLTAGAPGTENQSTANTPQLFYRGNSLLLHIKAKQGPALALQTVRLSKVGKQLASLLPRCDEKAFFDRVLDLAVATGRLESGIIALTQAPNLILRKA